MSQRLQTDEGYSAALFWSVVLHAAIVLLLASRLDFGRTRMPEIGADVIEAVVVDASVLQAVEQKKRQQAEQAAAERRRQEAERKAAEERKLQAEQERLKAEQERKLALQRQEAEKKAAEQKRLQEQRQKEEAARKAEEKRKQDETRKAEERAQLEAAQKREQEQMQAEAAAAAQQKELASALNLYQIAIMQKVMRHWVKVPSAVSGQTCRAVIRQIPGGEVISVEMRSCDGDAALQRSVEQAIYMASPLPEPPDPRVFSRDVGITFKVP